MTYKVTRRDIMTLAMTIYGEARSSSEQEQMAVGLVVLNRLKSPKWKSKTIWGVCRQKWQFSCWNGYPDRDANGRAMKAAHLGNPEYVTAYGIAASLCAWHAAPGLNDRVAYYYISPDRQAYKFQADHYMTHDQWAKTKRGQSRGSEWALGFEIVAEMRHHVFFDSTRGS